MILLDNRPPSIWSRFRKGFIILGLTLVGAGIVYAFLQKEKPRNDAPSEYAYYCDVEKKDETHLLGQNGERFNGIDSQSDEYAFSGKYSSKVSAGEGLQFGFSYKLMEFQPGDWYVASVWRYKPSGGMGFLVVMGEGETEFYKAVEIPVEERNGWEKLQINFKVPVFKKMDNYNFYVYSDGARDIYFDDLSIEKTNIFSAELQEKIPEIDLIIDDAAIKKLQQKRNEAFIAGLLESSDDDWVGAKLKSSDNEEDIDVELRLKGDWLDHLEEEKWSFRIKTKGSQVWERLHRFSIHTPQARSFLHEWLLHKLFEREDVLTTKYGFTIVRLNGKNLGVYAYEEHFDKVLAERQKRREGPIVRFSEEGFWAALKRDISATGYPDYEMKHFVRYQEAADIKPFQEARFRDDPLLKQQYEVAQNLMFQFQHGLRKPGDIFDIHRLAKYYAICETMSAFHGFAWHNQRFYYNVVTSKLEPVGFDGYSSAVERHKGLMGFGALNPHMMHTESMENFLFRDPEFTELYVAYLWKYTDPHFLQSFLTEVQPELTYLEELIGIEFENYHFNREEVIQFAQRTRALILPFDTHSVRAYTQNRKDGVTHLNLVNFHGLPVEVVGAGPSSRNMRDTFENPVLLSGFVPRMALRELNETVSKDSLLAFSRASMIARYRKQVPVSFSSISLRKKDKFLFFKVTGLDSLFYTTIKDFPYPVDFAPAQQLADTSQLVSNEIFTVSEGMVYFKKGKHTIRQFLIIPEGYRVIIPGGVHLDFTGHSGFVSYSPVIVKGTAEEHVNISSSDGTGNGFSVIQAKEKSILRYAIFDGLNTLNYKGWNLTGAVNFYESDAGFEYCVFKNNHCEDALNLIRSEFSLDNSVLSNTFSDAFDADFCKGSVTKTRFVNLTNDAMDFSGSNILIQDCFVDNAGDKGVSVGEDSDVSILNIDIINSNIGVAAKDLSVLSIETISLSNCEQGFVAFQKKPEYGAGNLIVKDFTANNVRRLYNIQEKSVLQLKEKLITGQ